MFRLLPGIVNLGLANHPLQPLGYLSVIKRLFIFNQKFYFFQLAEGVGFEPTDLAKGQRFSRPPHSSTLPSLRLPGAIGPFYYFSAFHIRLKNFGYFNIYFTGLKIFDDSCEYPSYRKP